MIIAGGTGFIGRQLAQHWLAQGHVVAIIGRSKKAIYEIYQNRVEALEWGALKAENLQEAAVVVNLAGSGIADKRWTKSRKEEILSSRIKPTQQLVALLSSFGSSSPPLFNASAIGVYGLQAQLNSGLPPKLDENTPIAWNQAPDFLSHVAREWEKATHPASQQGVRVVNLRFGVVLSKKGGALPRLAFPFHYFLGGPIGTGKQPFSWVALKDVIRAIAFLLEKPTISGPVNIVAPHGITQNELTKALGLALHRPTFCRVPAIFLKLALGEMADELLLEGQHVYPLKLLQQGFQFYFPDIAAALIDS
jgi:uncharacterized protein (TIGR01777 family)